MGYDLHRFVTKVDEELICPICTMVMENGMQSQHCEHTYCDACIKEWLTVNSICPVDKNELMMSDIIPIPRALKNLIMRLEIKCDFESYGCHEILKLGTIQSHNKVCVFNPNLKITCDKECRLEITRNEVERHCCVTKLSELVITQQKQISALESEMNELKAIATNWISPNGLAVSYREIECCNEYPTANEHENIFYGFQIAQYRDPLSKSNRSVEIVISDLGRNNFIGLALLKRYNDASNSERNSTEYLAFTSEGLVSKKVKNSDEATIVATATHWENGDAITVGIEIEKRKNATNNKIWLLHFKLNNALIYEERLDKEYIRLYYPTVYTNSVGAKVTCKRPLHENPSCNLL